MRNHLGVICFGVILDDREWNQSLQRAGNEKGAIVEIVCCVTVPTWDVDLEHRNVERFFPWAFHASCRPFHADR